MSSFLSLLLWSAGSSALALAAASTAFAVACPQVEPRRIIALTDASAEEHRDIEDPVALLVEMPLQHLGLDVWRWPIAAGPPPADWLAEARGVVTFFGTRRSDPALGQWVAPWLVDEVRARGLRLVVLGEPGVLQLDVHGRHDPRPWQRVLASCGLTESDVWNADPLQIEVQDLGPLRCAFEAPVLEPIHRGLHATGDGVNAWVRTRLRSSEDWVSPVLTGPFGGVALNPYVLTIGGENGERRWHLDLFEYFGEAFGLEGLPVFDPCVVNGRRAFFVQVDGDGFESLSTARPGAYAAEVFLRDVIDRFALPFTVSIIVASVTDHLHPTDDDGRLELAREVLTRPNVEVASHGVLHPLVWSAPYTRETPPRTVVWYSGLAGYEYTPRNEVEESVPFIDRLLDGTGRRTRTMLWSGDAIPPEDVLAATRERGLANVNGATYRWDAATDSIGYVKPHVRREGAELQVLCGGPNENVYGGFFDLHPGAFRHVATTLARAGSPRILKPANVYLHFYAAERPERLRSIQELLQRFGVDEPTAPIYASEWWGAAHDAFQGASRERLVAPQPGGAAFVLRGYGRCRTVRFDDEPRDLDLVQSPGVLGSQRLGEALYVHLAEEQPEQPTVLTLAPVGATPPPTPYLVEANHIMHGATRTTRGVVWRADSAAPRLAVLGGWPAHAIVRLRVGDEWRELEASEDGRVVVLLPSGADDVEVTFP